jgi:thioredoxin reductase (NADPH)
LGFYDLPYPLNVPGEDLPKVKHYYDEPHPYFGQNIIVVGAANSAVDVALETYRKGAKVTMVVREPSILETVKYWVKPDIENRIMEGSIKAYFNSGVLEIKPTSVTIKTPDGMKEIENDFVLAMTGYQPPFEFMESCGVKFHNDEFHTPVYNEKTNGNEHQKFVSRGCSMRGAEDQQMVYRKFKGARRHDHGPSSKSPI